MNVNRRQENLMTTATMPETRRHLARVLRENHTNDWNGSDPARQIAAARFAVVVERENDAWVLAADTPQDVANIALSTLTGTEGYDEWISDIWDMHTCQKIEWSQHAAVTVEIDGHTAIAQA
jgi:uncharacterized protein CbrC (UPF0167 family)